MDDCGYQFTEDELIIKVEPPEEEPIKIEDDEDDNGYNANSFLLNHLQNEEVKDQMVQEILRGVAADGHTQHSHTSGALYECFHCQHRTPDFEKLRAHIEVRHSGMYGFTKGTRTRCRSDKARCRYGCHFCGTKFEKRRNLREHLNSSHRGKTAFPCEYCSYRAMTSADLKSHVMFRHTKEHPFKCGYCTYSSASSGAVRRHLSVKHTDLPVKMSGRKIVRDPPRPVACDYCPYVAKNKSTLGQHVLSKHSSIKTFECSYCAFKTATKYRLQTHVVSRHTDERPFECAECGATFAEKKYLRRHIEVKHLEVKYFCKLCSFHAGYLDNLKRHVLSRHTNQKPFSCEYCSFKTAQKGNLKRHILLKHSLIRPLFCRICWYVTDNPAVLEKHTLTKHTNGKDFRCCPHCDYTTNSGSYLRNHIQSKHVTDKPFKCPQCKYSTCQSYRLKSHIAARHSDVRPHTCTLCDFRAATIHQIKSHINTRHTVRSKPLNRCPICSYTAVRKWALNNHMKRVHHTKGKQPAQTRKEQPASYWTDPNPIPPVEARAIININDTSTEIMVKEEPIEGMCEEPQPVEEEVCEDQPQPVQITDNCFFMGAQDVKMENNMEYILDPNMILNMPVIFA